MSIFSRRPRGIVLEPQKPPSEFKMGPVAALLALALGASGLATSCAPDPFDKAGDDMGEALEGDMLGRCVTRSIAQEWKIRMPEGERTFPVLRKEFPGRVAADDRSCQTAQEIEAARRDLLILRQALKRCTPADCAVTLTPR